MIRRLLFATIWGYVFSIVAMPLTRLAISLWGQNPADSTSDAEASAAMARLLVGVPGLVGIIGVAWAFAGLLPGTSWRRASYQPFGGRSLLRDLRASSFALRQFLDGYPHTIQATVPRTPYADLPRIALLTTGILGVILGSAGALYSVLALIRSDIPSRVVHVAVFQVAIYAISALWMGCCAVLVYYGLECAKGHTRQVRALGCLLASELLCFAMLKFVCRVLYWLEPGVGTSLGAAIQVGSSGFEVQAVVLFPLWGPFLALWAMYQLQARAAGEGPATVKVVRPGQPGVKNAELLQTLRDRYLAVRRMYEGFEYMLLLDASGAKRKAGIAAAAHFIRTRSEGENHYVRALTALCQAVEQALPAYEAAVIHDEVVFFQAVRSALLKAHSDAAILGGAPEPADDVPEVEPEIIPGDPSEILPRAAVLRPAARSSLHDRDMDLYDALEADDPEIEELGDEALHQLSDELIAAIRRHVTVDWTIRRGAKGEMRLMAKKILKKHKYPPNKHEAVVQAVLQRAEAFCLELGGTA